MPSLPANPYLDLTAEFNRGRLRTLLSSGQAVVFHRLAVMSKDGDWIVREDDEALAHVLDVLAAKGARYRFGAPLDRRWLAGGWSSHLEFRAGALRLRTDFVSRPPRIPAAQLAAMWTKAEATGVPVVDVEPLAALKLTNREKDYVVVGELARLMRDPRQQLRFSRSARDLVELAKRHPDLLAEMAAERPVLRTVAAGLAELEAAIDRERRDLMHRNEERLAVYERAAAAWARQWPARGEEFRALDLRAAHQRMVALALAHLPFAVPGGIP
ncbi:MAG: hypothetical protein WAT39_16085 [Planctomycetota bacterium]